MEMAEKILEMKEDLFSRVKKILEGEVPFSHIQKTINQFFADEIDILPEDEFWEKYGDVEPESLLASFVMYALV